MNEVAHGLLAADEPAPVSVRNEHAGSPFLITADHAGNLMPRSVHGLGLPASECERHIAYDIGIAGVCRAMADMLDANLDRAELFAASRSTATARQAQKHRLWK